MNEGRGTLGRTGKRTEGCCEGQEWGQRDAGRDINVVSWREKRGIGILTREIGRESVTENEG